MPHFSIRSKLTFAISALLIVSLSVMAFLTISFFSNHYKNAIIAQEFTLISTMGNEIDSKIELAQNMLIANATNFPLQALDDPEALQRFLDSRTGLHTLFDSHLFVFSPQGRIIVESPYVSNRRGLDVSYRDYIKHTVLHGKPYISDPYISTQADRQPAIMFTAPIMDEQGKLVAIFAGSLNLLKENFIGALANTKIGKTGYIYLYNQDRTIIIHPQTERILLRDVPLGSNSLFDKAAEGFEGSGEITNSRGVAYLASFKQLRTKNWILAANHPLSELYAPITEAKTFFFLASLLFIVSVLFIIRSSLTVLTKPLIELTKHVQELPQKTGESRLSGVRTSDEIGALSSAFDQMLLELDSQSHALTQSETKYRGIFEAAHDAIFVENLLGDIIDVNPAACKMMQYSREELIGMNISQLLPPEVRIRPEERLQQVLSYSDTQFVTKNVRKDGSIVSIEITAREYTVDSQVYFVVIARDITERIKLEEKLRYLSLHDPLTGLFDRAFFEEESLRLADKNFAPVGVVVCDIDGLKLINDTLGHSAGDKLITNAANLIKNCFRETDIITRIGGDEFAILLPNCSRHVVESCCQRVNDAVFQYNLTHPGLPLSISTGYSVGNEEEENNLSGLFREADDNMYREKLLQSQNARQALFKAILHEADVKDNQLGGHSQRVKELAEKLANRLLLPKSRISTLRRLAQYHDIGKVGVSEQILCKPGPLTPEERVKMQRHSDIGRRIAQSIPELSNIADLIWKHHEWWDGSGYPLGLRQEIIPLECRILAIAEAYDCMTHNQPYRPAMDETAAKRELANCAGSQFDPQLTAEFLAMLEEEQFAVELF